ncbi:MAG: hypothetical protein IPK81_21735 [Rhodospirillales bacterium]|nr:MAG: hypothetical protein IPK81_21735 [Rhodospirillales bacterium]
MSRLIPMTLAALMCVSAASAQAPPAPAAKPPAPAAPAATTPAAPAAKPPAPAAPAAPAASAAAARPVDERPMYGGVARTGEMKAADDKFIAEATAQPGGRAAAVDRTIEAAWKALREGGDAATAMKRFNHAWLLDPEDGRAYHGFATVALERDNDPAEAEKLFRRAMAGPKSSHAAFTDLGRLYLTTSRADAAVPVLVKAVALPDVSPDARALLAMARAESGDTAGACADAKQVGAAHEKLRQHAAAILRLPGCATP